jgi:hypothetical protein
VIITCYDVSSSAIMRGKIAAAVVPLALIISCGSSGSHAFLPVSASDSRQATPTTAVHPSSAAGLGATDTAWNSTHTADPDQPAGDSYDPDPSLVRAGDNGVTPDRYNGLIHNGGRVTDYVERFKVGTSTAAARSAARAELPSDATSVWSALKDGCAVDVFHSNQLATALGSVIDDKSGRVLVEYFSLQDQYNAGDVERARLEPGGDDPTAASLTSC